MNKQTVNRELQYAYNALSNNRIAKNGVIDKTFRGQISTFGAAITTGSLPAAIAFFSDDGGSSTERKNLLKAILEVLKNDKLCPDNCESLFEYSRKNENEAKDNILNAAIALKLAMNLYELKKNDKKG